MGTFDFVWCCHGDFAFKCNHGILGDSPDRTGGTVSPFDSEPIGAVIGALCPNLFLSDWYSYCVDGLYPSDGELLYFLSNDFSHESVLWIHIVAAQFPVRASGNCMYAGLLMSTIFDLYSYDDCYFERNLIPNG